MAMIVESVESVEYVQNCRWTHLDVGPTPVQACAAPAGMQVGCPESAERSPCIRHTCNGCFWHAADTAPLEGLSILRCAIYDPVEGLQISKMRFSEMGV